uniref:RNA-dependent RNA polymerase n=1 Tax=Gongylonema pulchrum TaxID=637853 RepID=A0A183EZ59_9BILA
LEKVLVRLPDDFSVLINEAVKFSSVAGEMFILRLQMSVDSNRRSFFFGANTVPCLWLVTVLSELLLPTYGE